MASLLRFIPRFRHPAPFCEVLNVDLGTLIISPTSSNASCKHPSRSAPRLSHWTSCSDIFSAKARGAGHLVSGWHIRSSRTALPRPAAGRTPWGSGCAEGYKPGRTPARLADYLSIHELLLTSCVSFDVFNVCQCRNNYSPMLPQHYMVTTAGCV